MLQPKKKNLNPSQKTKALTPKNKKPASYEVDWDAVRAVNDNVAVQAAKMFDPTGISSYPDVYYAAKDLSEGKGSWGELGLNILGALPMVGKAKAIFRLGKATNASKTIKNTVKVAKATEKLAVKANKVTNLSQLATSSNKVVKTVGKGAEKLEKVAKVMSKPITPKSKVITSKVFDAVDAKNLVVDVLDIANVGADATSVVKQATKTTAPKPLVDKSKVIKYYNTNPKHGKIETPGNEEGVQYVPISNSAELAKWKQQKLAFGTGGKGIDPKKPWLAPSFPELEPNLDFLNKTEEPIDFSKPQVESQGFADIGVSKNAGKFNVNSGINFNPETLAARVGASFNDKGFSSTLNYTQADKGFSEINLNAGYGNDFIQGEVDYSKTNEGNSLAGNLRLGDDKLRLILDYLKDSEGTNLKGGIESTTALRKGLLNSALELDTNFEDPKISGRINYRNPNGRLNINAGASYSEGEKANFNAGLNYSFALGTDKNGIMKSKMTPRKKYGNGTDAKGMNPNHYIISPSEALEDYNIMMAKAENAAINNPWAPYVSAIGGAASSFLSNSAGLLTKADGAAGAIKGNAGGILKKAIAKGGNIMASNSGGVVAAMGMNDVQKDVEVEGGEMYETPQGQVGEFQGPSHEQGGIPLEVGQNVEEGTKVYSDRLKVGDKTLAERKATRERKIANLEKIASDNLADEAVKNAAKRKMQAIQKEEMADLDFQEKVNNIQAMADMAVEAFACGTGMKGIQKYAGGTPPGGIKLPKAPTADMETNIIKNLHDALGIPSTENGYGIAWGPKSNAAMREWQKINTPNIYAKNVKKFGKNYTLTLKQVKDMVDPTIGPITKSKMGLTDQGYKYLEPETPDTTGLVDNTKTWDKSAFANATVEPNPMDAVIEAQPQETSNLDVAKALAGDTDTSTTTKEPSKFMKAFESSIPGIGDALKLFGNYKGMTAGIDTATEQRASDVPHKNVFEHYGEEAQRMLDNAKQGIEINKAQGIVKATSNTRGAMRGGRNSARGVNQMRGMDWLYNTALDNTVADIMANAAEKMSAIDIQKSGVSATKDQLKGQGEWQKDLADEAAKDAYFKALAMGRKDFATGLQQTGKDINDMKENKIIENLMKQYGTHVASDGSGNLFAKKRSATTTDKVEIPDGKGGMISLSPEDYKKFLAIVNKK